jgi:uncharacterized RDD family membrane protein YckC
MKTGALLIRTPEGIVFSQSLAGPVTRFLAWFVDFLCISILTSTIGTLLGVLRLISANIAGTAFTLGYFIISIGYGILLEWTWRGQTIGKKMLRLRVIDVEGMRLQFDQVMTRNLLRFVDMLPAFYFVGGLACLLNRNCQRLGDIAANTVVIRTPTLEEPDLDQLLTGKFNSLRQYPHLAARLRQRVSPAEIATALQAIIRRNDFEPAARVNLFEQLAAHFRSKVNFPREATDGISDEQYLRNLVDVVMGRSVAGMG